MTALFMVALMFTLQSSASVLESPPDGYASASILPDFLWQECAWGGVSAVDGYQIQVATDSGFSLVIIDDTVEIARYVPCDHPLTSGSNYYWRVRCLSGATAGGWSETSEFTVADFAGYIAEIYASDSLADVRGKFALAKANSPATVRLSEDVCWGADDSDDILNLSGYANIHFDGNGKSITVTNPSNRLFHVPGCTNLIFSSFSVDYNPLPYVLCEVIETDTVNNRLIVQTISNAANPCLELNDPVMLGADKTHMRLLDKSDPGAVKYGAAIYIHDGKQTYSHSYLTNGVLHHVIDLSSRWYTADQFEIGDYMLRVARGVSRNIIRSANSEGICVNNVTAFASPSQFVSSIDGSGLIVVNSRAALKDGRYSSVTADSVYVRRNRIGPWIQDCSFTANGDDCMNFHSVGSTVTERVGDYTLRLTNASSVKAYAVGDDVAIWDPAPGSDVPVYTRIVSTDLQGLTITLADCVGTIDLSHSDPVKNSLVFNLTKSNRRFFVKNNIVNKNARFGILLSSQNGVVIGNTFNRCAGDAVRIGTDPGEGLNAADILIQDNRIAGCGYSETFFASRDGAVTLNAYGGGWTEVFHRFHDSISIVNNRIDGWECAAFKIKGSSNVLLDNNIITDGGMTGFPNPGSCNDVILVGNAGPVTAVNTTLSDARAYTSYFYDAGGTDNITIASAYPYLPKEGSGTLLNEGGFENSGASWTLNTTTVDGEFPGTGQLALKISGNGLAKSEFVPVKGNTRYTLYGWIKGSSLSGGTKGARIDAREYRKDGGAATVISPSGWQTGTFDYAFFEKTFVTQSDTGRIQVYCVVSEVSSGTAYFDDLTLIEGDRNLISNGSFDLDLSGWIYASSFSHVPFLSHDSSSGSIKMSQPTAASVNARHKITGDIEGGSVYTVSGSLWIPEALSGAGNGARIFLKFYRGEQFLGQTAGGTYKSETGGWIIDTFTATAPEGADNAILFAIINDRAGTVFFDRFKLVRNLE
jgi:hypothetical protein